jgi:hypothetical protein
MKNVVFYILLILMIITIVSIVLGYFKFGFAIGFIFGGLAMSVGYYTSMKSQDYVHKSWHNDYVDRHRR